MPREFPARKRAQTEISADYTETDNLGNTTLKGNVIIEKHLLRMSADKATYNSDTELLNVSGNVHIDTTSMSLDADDGTVNLGDPESLNNDATRFRDISFFIPESSMKGAAKVIVASKSEENHQLSTLTDATITSCNLLDPDWLISADELRLDHDDEYGSADDVVIRFKDVPFLYTPYIEFPTSDRRRTGILFPEFGTSSSRGIELGIPWYWNIAPNQDALLTPRYMEKRGIDLGAEYRYLTSSTKGELKGAYLPSDDITGEDRYQVRYEQRSRIANNLVLNVDVQDISDTDYFNDFANSLGVTSQTYLDRRADLNYALSNWQLNALVQDIKTIDTTTPASRREYSRLPQFTLQGNERILGSVFFFDFDSEFVDFTHEDDAQTTGRRLTVKPALDLSMQGQAWFLKPRFMLYHTRYDVGAEDNSIVVDQPENLTLPVSSIDAGLFFERYLDNGLQQTLEPRLYYLHTPFEDQDAAPIFDTRLPQFTFSQLFRENRFVGGDRMGDANQITAAVTSRILDNDSGDELLRTSIGQIFYFEDRKVTLRPVDPDETDPRSDIVFELDSWVGNWEGNIDLQWDPFESHLNKQNYFLHYKSDDKHLINLGYRQQLNSNGVITREQTDLSFVYAITSQVNSVARWNYSLLDRESLDTILGLSYDSCCWAIQVVGQRRIQNSNSRTSEFDNSILIQFVFKGLGSLSGSEARRALSDSIYGYNDPLDR